MYGYYTYDGLHAHDDNLKIKLAKGMWDLVKPGGYILWYDFISLIKSALVAVLMKIIVTETFQTLQI